MSMAFEYLPRSYSKYKEEATNRRKRLMFHDFQQGVLITYGAATGAMWNGLHPDAIPTPRIFSAEILRIVSEVTCVCRHDLMGPYRKHNIVRARHIAYYLIRSYTWLSFPGIGKLFGGKHHSTVMHGYHFVQARPQDFEPWLSRATAKVEALR